MKIKKKITIERPPVINVLSKSDNALTTPKCIHKGLTKPQTALTNIEIKTQPIKYQVACHTGFPFDLNVIFLHEFHFSFLSLL